MAETTNDTPVRFPKTGVGVIIIDPRSPWPLFVLGRRKNKHGHGDGLLSFPGGKFEEWEEFEDCCKREVMEEVGVEIERILPFCFTNDKWEELGLHYITMFFVACIKEDQVLKNMEPDKCEGWDWYNLNKREGDPYAESVHAGPGLSIPSDDQLFTPLDKILNDRYEELHDAIFRYKLDSRFDGFGLNKGIPLEKIMEDLKIRFNLDAEQE